MPNNEVLLGEANSDGGDGDDKSTIHGMLSGVDKQNYLNLKKPLLSLGSARPPRRLYTSHSLR